MRKKENDVAPASLTARRRTFDEMAQAVTESAEANGGNVERVSYKEMRVVFPGNDKPIRVILCSLRRMSDEDLVLAEHFIAEYKNTRRPS